ncbi:hypothetical protein C0989_005768 [Termitomyces sp. Mn162]|nr:hypothetical protein C0989_005768 [Termitomyces sp. Mn162]
MSVYNSAYNPASYLTNIYSWLVPENPYAPFYPGPPVDQHSMPPPSAKEFPQASAALQHFLPMAAIPACTLEDTLQHPPTLPTFPPPATMHTQSPLQPQPLQST